MHSVKVGAISGERAGLFFSAIVTISILNWMLRYAGYGVDFTDESFYLVSISNPFLYDGSVTQFGYIYQPLFLLVDGNIAHLRQINVLITFALAWLLVYELMGAAEFDGAALAKISRLTVAAGFATASLTLFNTWLLTPSYNSLALQAVLITAIGLCLADKSLAPRSALGWMLLASGGWLSFMAKPSTAAILALSAGVYLYWTRKISLAWVAFSALWVVALLLASALVIDGTVSGFINRLQIGLESARILGGGHNFGNIIRIDGFKLNPGEFLLFTAVGLAAYGLGWLRVKNENVNNPLVGVGFGVAVFLVLGVTLSITWGWAHISVGFGEHRGVLMGAAALPAALLGIKLRKHLGAGTGAWDATCMLFLVLPFVYAFGSNVNYWKMGGAASIFWLISGLCVLIPAVRGPGRWRIFLPLVFATQLMVVLLVNKGMETPNRQVQPLWLNTNLVEFGRAESKIWLSHDYGEYVKKAIDAANAAGFVAGTPVIDLTGQSPGLLYAMQAESIGQAWMIGGYPGSLNLAAAAIRRVDCGRVARAWLLVEPNGPRSIPLQLLEGWGGDLHQQYEQVAQWQTAEGVGGYLQSRTQILLKPIRDHAIGVAACETSRVHRASE